MNTYNAEVAADRAKEIYTARLIDGDSQIDSLEYTPATLAAFKADEAFHTNLKRQAAQNARARKLGVAA